MYLYCNDCGKIYTTFRVLITNAAMNVTFDTKGAITKEKLVDDGVWGKRECAISMDHDVQVVATPADIELYGHSDEIDNVVAKNKYVKLFKKEERLGGYSITLKDLTAEELLFIKKLIE